jgi:hypothetical protein
MRRSTLLSLIPRMLLPVLPFRAIRDPSWPARHWGCRSRGGSRAGTNTNGMNGSDGNSTPCDSVLVSRVKLIVCPSESAHALFSHCSMPSKC